MMQGNRRYTLNVALASAFVFASGCATQMADEELADQYEQEAQQIQAALNEQDGGMSKTDEASAFNDAEVLAVTALNENYTDQQALNIEPSDGPNAQRYHLFLMWGHLPAKTAGTEPQMKLADWTGSVSLDRGRIGLRRALRFDAHDYVEPRSSLHEISFVSRTLPAVDGLLLEVVAEPDEVLVFDTVSLQTKIPLAVLAGGGDGYVSLGDNANGFVYSGYGSSECDQGFVFGHWKDLPIWDVGRFRGRVVSRIGNDLGFVKGHYGYSSQLDDDVYFGKYIDQHGKFSGLLGGSYENGQFVGHWATVKHEHGKLKGYYFPGIGDDRGRFLGQWVEGCNVTTGGDNSDTNSAQVN